MSTSTAVKAAAKMAADKALHILRHEPIAVWGLVLAAVLGVLPLFGVPYLVINSIGTALTLLGVPVVRGKVTPKAAVQALIDGAKSESP